MIMYLYFYKVEDSYLHPKILKVKKTFSFTYKMKFAK